MRALIDEYGAAVVARVAACHISIAAGFTPGCKAPLLIAAEEREKDARERLDDAVAQASSLVAQVISEVETIDRATPQRYSDDPTVTEGYRANFERASNARRKFTLKDARPLARYSARLLREAWEVLDPALKGPFTNA